MKKLGSTTATATIPEDIIIEIFSKITTVKSLIRFTCVSKSSYSLIYNPHFLKSHLHRSIQSPNNHKLLISNDLKEPPDDAGPFLYDPRSGESMQIQRKLFKQPFSPNQEYDILCSCDGLLLLSTSVQNAVDSHIVWNPLTGESRKLPRCIPGDVVSYYGFGYDMSTDDYKVIQCTYPHNLKDAQELRVLSLKSNSWKVSSKIQNPINTTGTNLNGVIYWLCNSRLIKFYLAEETLIERKLRRLDGILIDNKYQPSILQGKLCIMQLERPPNANGSMTEPYCLDFWVKQEHGADDSFTYTETIEMPEGVHDVSILTPLTPLCFVHYSVMKTKKDLILFDMEKQAFKDIVIFNHQVSEMTRAFPFVESLVSPNPTQNFLSFS